MEAATSAGQERPVVDAEAALRFLAEASSVLGGSLDYEETVRRVAHLLVPRIADWAGVDVVETDGSTRQLTSSLDEPELQSFLMSMRERYREGEDQAHGTRAVLEGSRSILVRDAAQMAPPALAEEEQELY